MTQINNVKDLAVLLGMSREAAEEDSLRATRWVERMLFKHTDCGAWFSTRTIPLREEQTWRLQYSHDGYQWNLSAAECNGEPVDVTKFAALPECIMEYGCLEYDWDSRDLPHIPRVDPTWAEANETLDAAGEGHWFEVTEMIELEGRSAYVAVIGTIVEGVDEEPEPIRLTFPFTDEAWWKAVQEIEEAAKEIWNATHGCPWCYDWRDRWHELAWESIAKGESQETFLDRIKSLESDWEMPDDNPVNKRCPACRGAGMPF